MDEKTIQRIKKLQALAERGVGGEKTTAQKKLAKLLKDNGINSLDELQKEEYEYTIFSYNGKHEIKLLRQCMYKVMGIGAESKRCLIMQNRRAYPLQTLICSWAFYGKNCRDTQQ